MTTTTVKKKTVKKKAAPKKKAPQKKTAKQEEPALQIIQTSKCQTISGKSTLTYNIAVDDKNNIFIRIFSNSGGGGYFSIEYIRLDRITAVLSDIPKDRPITSLYLSTLFTGRSANNSGFLLAVLVNEGLLVPFEGMKRKYVFVGTDKFVANLQKKLK